MKVVITGGAGFIGLRLANYLLSPESPIQCQSLTLVDIAQPSVLPQDSRLNVIINNDDANTGMMKAITAETNIVFHLAAVVSSHAEAEFEFGMKINVDMTRQLIAHIRDTNPKIRLVFASSLAVFGGNLPSVITDQTALQPQSSYGMQKACCELMIHDASRKGFLDGIVLRCPTVSVRPGKPNLAASSFASGIIREPLSGQTSNCPVDTSLALWLASPDAIIQHFVHAAQLAASEQTRVSINLPGLTVTVQEMLDGLVQVAGKEILQKLSFERQPAIERIVASWPSRFDISTALSLGFKPEISYVDNIKAFIKQELGDK